MKGSVKEYVAMILRNDICNVSVRKSRKYLSDVSLGIEVPEEYNEGDHVNNESVLHPKRKVAAGLDAVDTKNQSSRKLDQLEDGQVLFPPEVFGYGRSKRRQPVIRVHEHVDEAVYHCR
jgi:hypothetical protein